MCLVLVYVRFPSPKIELTRALEYEEATTVGCSANGDDYLCSIVFYFISLYLVPGNGPQRAQSPFLYSCTPLKSFKER